MQNAATGDMIAVDAVMRCQPAGRINTFPDPRSSAMRKATYRQLDTVLRSFGFKVYDPEPGTRVYRYPDSRAFVTFPVHPDGDKVLPHHLVGTRMVLEAFGIADPPEFESRLQKVG
ncbi:unnamed protein product [Gemmataceae bacterium]|nr:unnamed protein product [Gemmataceae bacterium]VTT99726.1 unnamed protein product [Gemmataceae bacterium]